jgi:hypothetical protein
MASIFRFWRAMFSVYLMHVKEEYVVIRKADLENILRELEALKKLMNERRR